VATNIHLDHLRCNKTLSRIPEDKMPNDPVILDCYKNAMPWNVKYAIRTSQMDTLEEAMTKGTEMEEIMIETVSTPTSYWEKYKGSWED
jgi:hypothetical protein